LSSRDDSALEHRWFPICGRHDLPARHVFETELLGQELAVWQGPGGNVNVWENRCPHRGMRLTLGANLGRELRCAYHGYRFADGSGLCTSVPAQPDRPPPRSLSTKVYPMLDRGGLIWTRLSADDPVAEPPVPDIGTSIALYRVTVNSAAPDVAALLADYRFRPSGALGAPPTEDERCSTSAIDEYSFRSLASQHRMTTEVRLLMQPVGAQCTVIHGVLLDGVAEELRLPTLRHHARLLGRLRDVSEGLARPTSGASSGHGRSP
jgi:nitrite reductase/ring-hydroxylating ferredoxin subunit